MKQKQLLDLLENRNIVVPLLFFKQYKKLDIGLEEFIFLMYLKDNGKSFVFDSQTISLELGFSVKEVLKFISILSEKKLLVIDTFKNDKGIVEEKVDLSLFYEKISNVIVDEVNVSNKIEFDDNIFSLIEKEFGRTLNPSELEFIKAWANTFNSDIIVEAVKEAVLNGVSSIRYIDKILYEWDKKGIKTKEDVMHFLSSKKSDLKEPIEVFDYDWFDDDE